MSETREIILLKLGGSLITDKRRPESARSDVIERLAQEVRLATDELEMSLILGHGSGSFGHVSASGFQIQRGVETRDQVAGVSLTQESVFKLHRIVVSALRGAGVNAFSLAPSSFAVANRGEPEMIWSEPVVSAVRLGLVPVVFGDVLMDRALGATICSTENLFRALVPALGSRGLFVRRVVWLGETDGIYDQRGETIAEIQREQVAAISSNLEGAAGTDVTGGIRHRLETAALLAGQGISSWIGNGLRAGALLDGLKGEAEHGTEVLPGR